MGTYKHTHSITLHPLFTTGDITILISKVGYIQYGGIVNTVGYRFFFRF